MSRTYPLMSISADFSQGPPNAPGVSAVQLLPDSAAGGVPACRGWSTTRGRQYELDVVQAGTASLDVVDAAEWLNPVNSGSPWNSGVNSLLPYRCVQIGAWWNTATKDTTGNLLNSSNKVFLSTSSYDPSFESGTSVFFAPSGSPSFATSTAQHFAGAQSLAATFTAVADKVGVSCVAPVGRQMTLSVYVFVPASHTATLTWSNQTPALVGSTIGTATSSTTAAWQRLTVTGVPAGPVSLLQVSCSAVYPATVYLDALQLELGGTASAWTASGPTFFPIYTGYVERYPQQWDSQGFRGLKPLEAVDALSVLSRTTITQSYAATIAADSPTVVVPFSDDAFPMTINRPLGGQPFIPYQQLGPNSSSIQFGGDTFLDGSKTVALSQQNTNPVNPNLDNTQASVLGSLQGNVAMNPQSFTLEFWMRWTSGQFSIGAGFMQPGETTAGSLVGPAHRFGFQVQSNYLIVIYVDSAGTVQVNSFINNALGKVFADDKWHYCVFTLLGGNTWKFVYDDFPRTSAGTLTSTPPSTAVDNIYCLAASGFGDSISTASFANVSIYPFGMTNTQAANHYQRGIGYLGEKSGARALRLLTQYWSSNVVTGTGQTPMAADFSYNGRAMLDVLQEIAETENGLVWADASGLIHQDSRETRYTTATTPLFVFGENSGAGELPYEELEYDYDPTYVYSEADLTAGGTGTQLPAVVNATSQTAYGQRILSKTLQMQNDWDVNQAGLFYVQRYAKPAGAAGTGIPPRISKMTLNPAANPNLFAAVLSMDIGTRITVKRRTSAVTISGDYYVEQINHDASGDASSWKTDLQLSPVFVSQPWILGDATKGVLGSTTVTVY